MDKILLTASRIISGITYPLLLPVYAVLISFCATFLWYMPAQPIITVLLVTIAMTTMAPVIAIYMMHHFGIISDPLLNDRRDRTYPLGVAAVCFGVLALYLWVINAPAWMVAFAIGASALVIFIIPINLKWKISGHAAGVGGLTALCFFIAHMGYTRIPGSFIPSAMVIISGLVGTSRLILGRHTLSQVAAGYLLGFATLFIALILSALKYVS